MHFFIEYQPRHSTPSEVFPSSHTDSCPHTARKQSILNQFSSKLNSESLHSCFTTLKQGISGHRDLSTVQSLFERDECTLGISKYAESASLAMIAVALTAFGTQILDNNDQINFNKLEMALHMLFGKDMPVASWDMLLHVKTNRHSNYQNNGLITLSCEKYAININPTLFAGDKSPANELVNPANINQSFFHGVEKSALVDFFGNATEVPAILFECAEKNFQQKPQPDFTDPRAKEKQIKAMADNMRQGMPMYHNETITRMSDGRDVTHTLSCQFLIDSAPALIEKYDPEEIGEAEKNLPVNTWRAEFTDKNDDKSRASSITLAASQHTEDPDLNKKAAMAIIDGIVGQFPCTKPYRVIIDLRVLTTIDKKIVTGNEVHVFERHTKAMHEATTDWNNAFHLTYLPIHCEAHSHLDTYFAKSVSAIAGLTVVGLIATHHVYKKTTFSSEEQRSQLEETMHCLYNQMSEVNRKLYKPILVKWTALLPELHHSRHAIPFATLTKILQDAVNDDPDTDTKIEFIVGCKSAKDRTSSLVAGINMFEPLIRGELEKGEDCHLERFFDAEGYFAPASLTPDELILIKNLYDIRLLHAPNKFNAGVAGNVSYAILTDFFFKNVEFIHNSNPHTILVGC